MSAARITLAALLGRSFISPVADYVLIGGAWSLVVTAYLLARPPRGLDLALMAALVLLVNSAHFAASTVRLYSKKEHYERFPFLTLVLPLLVLGLLALCIALPESVGHNIQALYLTWSPYHYAAQAYGLGLMYCARSGCTVTPAQKWVFWSACMLPFLRSFIGAPNSGLGWFVPRETLMALPIVPGALVAIVDLLLPLIFVVPVVLFVRAWLAESRQPVPLIVPLMLLANGLWWTALDYLDAFVIATIAHGLQYLAIVVVVHTNERMKEPSNQRGRLYHVATFYGVCLILGYGLFYCWPYAFVWAGAGLAESMLLVTAIINIHHFVVDRYIWRQSATLARQPAAVSPA